MSFGPGTRLGPYEVVSALGSGGMGEVYRATDTNLGRQVAIKVLPDSFAHDAERIARFEREAKTLAALNHPNIAQIYGLEKSQGTYALVMELVEGEDLSQRIARGPIPLDEALPIAKQIAEALEAAHEPGIIHRDLKPANIKIRSDGAVKVLDFGLAKLGESSAAAVNPSTLSMSPTITSPAMTGVGVLLGTAAYMSPEQARGKPADKRSDIWAFGCVLYEMLAARRAFPGDDVSETLAGVIKSEPDWSALPDVTPASVRRLLRRCLQKDRRRRLHDAGDARIELEEPPDAPPIVAAPSRPRSGLPWLIAFVSAFVGAVAAGALFYRPAGSTEPIRFFATAPDGWEIARLSAPPSTASPNPLTISPDGRTLAFVARSMDGKFQIWLRSLATLTARPLEGTEGASSPFWSPDSSALGFFAGGKLKKIALSGGPPFTLADAPNERGGTWSREGMIVFAPTANSPLMKVSAAGGTPVAVTKLGGPSTGHRRPFFLPDGRHLLYHGVGTSQDRQRIYLGSIDSSEETPLITSDTGNVAYAPGYLLFIRETTLMAQSFDVNRLTLSGDPFPVAEQIQIAGYPPVGVFSLSETGVLAYQMGTQARADTELTWFDRAGKKLGTLGTPGPYSDVELSRDAKQVSINLPDQTSRARDIWLFDVARNLRTRFTFNAADDLVSIWSPDRSRVVYNSRRNGKLDLYVKAANGEGTEELLFEDQFDKVPTSWAPDGQHLLYISFGGAATSNDLFVLPLSGERKPTPFATMPFSEAPGAFSPDGRWIAYGSNESGTNELYVAPFPARGGKWQVSNAGAGPFRWSRNGDEIVYLAPDGALMAVDVNGRGTAFQVGAVKPLFRARIAPTRYEWAVTPDGQRFLINTPPEQTESPPITVVLNWAAGLKK